MVPRQLRPLRRRGAPPSGFMAMGRHHVPVPDCLSGSSRTAWFRAAPVSAIRAAEAHVPPSASGIVGAALLLPREIAERFYCCMEAGWPLQDKAAWGWCTAACQRAQTCAHPHAVIKNSRL